MIVVLRAKHPHGTLGGMVFLDSSVGPSFEAVRPTAAAGTDVRFPVYDDLTDRLVNPEVDPATGEPDPLTAHVLAVAAGYAYSDGQTVAEMMTRLGMEKCTCLTVSFRNDTMFVASTAHVLQSEDGRVVLVAFRGTEPVNLISWLTDVDTAQQKVRLDEDAPIDVHPGFYRNVRAIRYQLREALVLALAGKAVDGGVDARTDRAPMEALYFTGHSLGGAMAALMALLVRRDGEDEASFGRALAAVYTYGQPMVGSPALAATCDADPRLGGRLFRYVYEGDPIPGMPSRDTGRWGHFGRERHHLTGLRDAGWQQKTSNVGQIRFVGQIAVAFGSLPLSQLLVLQRIPFLYRIDDHRPQHYIENLAPEGAVSEFGDRVYAVPPAPALRLRRTVEHWGRRVTSIRRRSRLATAPLD
jgi:hypothetical protein